MHVGERRITNLLLHLIYILILMTNYEVGERHNTNMFQHLIYIHMTNYDGISENMGIHGPMLYIFKMLAVKNAE